MTDRVRVRGGTAAERTASMPVLAARELACTTDDGMLYIGDGATIGGKAVGSGTYAPIGYDYGSRLVVTGDSITAGNGDQPNLVQADSWGTHLALASGGALTLIRNSGHAGYTSTQLDALFAAEVMAYSPGTVGIMAGTNDVLDGDGKPTATATAIRSMVAKAQAGNAAVVLLEVPPQGATALATPSAPTPAVVATGGTLTAATYRYKVTAVNAAGETLPSTVGSVVVASGTQNSINVDFAFVEGASGYNVYRETTPGSGTYGYVGQSLGGVGQAFPYLRVTDTGATTPVIAPPVANTTAVAFDATKQAKIAKVNAWLRQFGTDNGIPVVGVHELLVDPATGLYKAGYTGDGTHPTTTRQKYLGQAAWGAISSRASKSLVPVTQHNADPANLYSNGCMMVGSANLPTSYASYGTATGYTDTLDAKAGFLGKALTAAMTVPSARYHDSPAVAAGFSAGDRIRASFVVQTESSEAGGGQAYYEVRCNGSNTSPMRLVLTAADIGPAVWTAEFTVPVATTSIYFKAPYLQYGTITASLGQLTLYNETTGGLLL